MAVFFFFFFWHCGFPNVSITVLIGNTSAQAYWFELPRTGLFSFRLFFLSLMFA